MCSKMADIIPSKISQKEKDKYCMISFICGIYRKESPNSKEQRIDWWLPGAGKQREMGSVSQKVQAVR